MTIYMYVYERKTSLQRSAVGIPFYPQNNFFKLDNKRREDENVSNNDDDAFHEVQKNDLLENLSYQKSPSGASRLLS